jgi:hypothetical protein
MPKSYRNSLPYHNKWSMAALMEVSVIINVEIVSHIQ